MMYFICEFIIIILYIIIIYVKKKIFFLSKYIFFKEEKCYWNTFANLVRSLKIQKFKFRAKKN